jgi:putative oxygen-independent coproporphyrinogen III oxidase
MKVCDDTGNADKAGPGFGVYVHWPFCQSKCPYCDFNSHVSESIDHDAWVRAYAREIAWTANELPERPVVTSIFFGGGTPSLMPPETTAAVLDAIRAAYPVAGDVEITLEANPSSVEVGRFQGYREAGVNRVSIGVQSLDNQALKFLGRLHDVKSARAAIDCARSIFPRYSFDMIYAYPDHEPDQWRKQLSEAITLSGDHLSVYQLTIESGTPFARSGVPAAPEETAEALFHVTNDVLDSAGLPAYEISNHAKPGSECRHNMLYWRGGGHVGIGPGAHGRTRARTQDQDKQWTSHYRIHTPARWLDQVETQEHGTAKTSPIPTSERIDEAVLMGLRLRQGLSRDDFVRATGQTFEHALDADNLRVLTDGGFLVLDDQGLRATNDGWMRLNAVIAKLLS